MPPTMCYDWGVPEVEPHTLTTTMTTTATITAPVETTGEATVETAMEGPLTGPDLIAKVKELGEVSKTELVRGCGYVSTKKDGTERLNFTAFYEALLDAKGVSLGGKESRKGFGGRQLTYTTHVHFNGNLMVGKAYLALGDFKPGDTFEIKLSKGGINLIPVEAGEET